MRPIRLPASVARGARVRGNIRKGDATCDALVHQCEPFMGVAQRELRFAPPRRFRFDVAFPAFMVAVEVHGGTWNRGGHVRGAQFASDCEKMALALIYGWRVLPVTTQQVESGQAAEWLRRLAGTP